MQVWKDPGACNYRPYIPGLGVLTLFSSSNRMLLKTFFLVSSVHSSDLWHFIFLIRNLLSQGRGTYETGFLVQSQFGPVAFTLFHDPMTRPYTLGWKPMLSFTRKAALRKSITQIRKRTQKLMSALWMRSIFSYEGWSLSESVFGPVTCPNFISF